MEGKIKYVFLTKMWKDITSGSWFFVSLPKATSKEKRANLKWQEEGWGSMKAFAQINDIQWKTAIWYEPKSETYLLPIKADIRKKSKLEIDKEFEMNIWI